MHEGVMRGIKKFVAKKKMIFVSDDESDIEKMGRNFSCIY
jgi:hypothetical protein